MKKKYFVSLHILFYLTTNACAEMKKVGLETFDFIGKQKKIDKEILYSVAEIESSGNPYSIGANIRHDLYAGAQIISYCLNNGISLKYNHICVNIKPKNKIEALTILNFIKSLRFSNRFSLDLGLMQVNSQNAKERGWSEELLLTDPEYNIDKGAELLRDCHTKYRNDKKWLPKTVECYNKGKNGDYNYEYYKRWGEAFLKTPAR